MGQTADDRRKFERLEISTQALMEVEGQSDSLQLHTKDISAGGAFFVTPQPLEAGKDVKVEMVIRNDTISKLTGTHFQLRVSGTVVRCETEGMAVCFNSHEITPLRSTMDN